MRTALITGASGGIGAAVARRISREGCAVALHCHQNEPAVRALQAELTAAGGRAIVLRADLSDSAQANAMVTAAVDGLGHLDCLVCNAGLAHAGLLTDLTDADWRRVMGVNLDGVFYVLRAALPHFVARRAGSIVTVSSMWGEVGASCEAAYSAAKAGVIGLTKALAKEVGPSGVRVNCVAPGVIDTPMNQDLTADDLAALAGQTPLGRIGTPDEAAAAIAFLCSADAGFLTGQVLGVSGGLIV